MQNENFPRYITDTIGLAHKTSNKNNSSNDIADTPREPSDPSSVLLAWSVATGTAESGVKKKRTSLSSLSLAANKQLHNLCARRRTSSEIPSARCFSFLKSWLESFISFFFSSSVSTTVPIRERWNSNKAFVRLALPELPFPTRCTRRTHATWIPAAFNAF